MKDLALLFCLAATAVEGHAVWATHSLTKIFPDTPPPPSPSPLELLLCRGETGGFQIAVQAGPEGIDEAWLEPFEFRLDIHRIPVREPAIYRQHTVMITTPSGNADRAPHEWPDALIPAGLVKDRSIPAGRTVAFWLDVAVPEELPAGRYLGTCRVLLDGRAYPLSLAVRVVDQVLPVTRHVRANVAVYYDDILLGYANQNWRPADDPWTTSDPDYTAIKRAYYELLLEHRLTAYDLPVPMDSAEADRYYADPRVHSIRLPWMDDQGSERLRRGIARARERGAFDELYYYAADEPPAAAYPSVREAAEHFRAIAPDIPFVVTVAPVEPLLGSVDIWAPNLGNFIGLGYLDEQALAERRAAGEETWWYTCCVPLAPYPTWLVDDDAVAPRATIWLMAKYGLTGFVYSMAHGWSPNPYESVASFNDTNGDGLLFYPGQPYGTTDPFPSLRLKLLRDGLQDYEVLRLLAEERDAAARRRGLEPDGWRRVETLTEQVVQSFYRVERDPAVLLAAREQAIAELLAARRYDFLPRLERGPSGVTVAGVVRPGAALHAGGLPLEVTEDGGWSVAVPPGTVTIELQVGELDVPLRVTAPVPAPFPSPAELVVPFAATPLELDGRAAEAVWSQAPALLLENGTRLQFASDSDALWIAAEAGQATVVLDPGRTHEAAYTFTFTNQPRRAIRRDETGRDPAYEPAWEVAGAELLEARIPFAALGMTPAAGDAWGATAIGYTPESRSFWFDHHGDLRTLPTLRFGPR